LKVFGFGFVVGDVTNGVVG